MKRAGAMAGYILFALIALLPLGALLCGLAGYSFALVNEAVFAVVTALAAIGAVILLTSAKDLIENRILIVLLALTAPLSLVNAAFYLLAGGTGLIVVCMAVCVCCCCYLAFQYGRPAALKITCLVLSALMLCPVGLLGFMALVFGGIAQSTVVESVASPNGGYYAEVIDSDQGALGGNTLVKVYERKQFNAWVFKIFKTPQKVYIGSWGEFENMEIHWRDEHCLLIDGEEYPIAL